jgi:hypothetical protein
MELSVYSDAHFMKEALKEAQKACVTSFRQINILLKKIIQKAISS